MTKKAIIITLVSLGVAGAGIFGGIKAYQNYQKISRRRYSLCPISALMSGKTA